MSDYPIQATPPADLETQICSSAVPKNEREWWAHHEIERLRAERDALRAGILAVQALIDESAGVAGLHLNGDVAPWDELRTGGRFETWLKDFDAAVDAARKEST